MNDLISRQAAIKKLKDNLTYMMTFGADRSEVLAMSIVRQSVKC